MTSWFPVSHNGSKSSWWPPFTSGEGISNLLSLGQRPCRGDLPRQIGHSMQYRQKCWHAEFACNKTTPHCPNLCRIVWTSSGIPLPVGIESFFCYCNSFFTESIFLNMTVAIFFCKQLQFWKVWLRPGRAVILKFPVCLILDNCKAEKLLKYCHCTSDKFFHELIWLFVIIIRNGRLCCRFHILFQVQLPSLSIDCVVSFHYFLHFQLNCNWCRFIWLPTVLYRILPGYTVQQ